MNIDNADGKRELETTFYICSNDSCNKISLDIEIFNLTDTRNGIKDQYCRSSTSEKRSLLPTWQHKIFPDYIPLALLKDYKEAYAIKELSPKASATLSRRCLQWIIRDFWWISENTLYQEINKIEDKIDPLLFKAINAVRKIGNIWAHMEKDINLIVEIDPNEAEKLIKLIELLFKEFYITRHEREKQLEDIIGIQEWKEELKKEDS